MPDETTRTVTVDGVTWGSIKGTWAHSPIEGVLTFSTRAEQAFLGRIAALEAEREEIEAALRALASHVARLGVNPTIPDLLAWHRARGATQEQQHTEGRDNG